MVDAGAEGATLEFTSTWVVAVVCCAIVLISFLVQKFLQCAGQLLRKQHEQKTCKGKRKHLFHALQKVKEELMLLGFISLLLSVFQTRIGKICIPERLANVWLPCRKPEHSAQPVTSDGYTTDYCAQKGKVPLLSVAALHHLHIFIFVLATFHVIVCVVIILCGEAKLWHWRKWDESIIKNERKKTENDLGSNVDRPPKKDGPSSNGGRRPGVISRLLAGMHIFRKHLFPSLTKSEYTALRLNCINVQTLERSNSVFQDYIMSRVQEDFNKVVGISWYLWLFVVLFLLLNVAGWNAYFWISFLPLTLLLVVGAKLEHTVTKKTKVNPIPSAPASISTAKFSEEDFWFKKPSLVLHLIHILLFQNSFELAFFFFILFQYDFNSCIMGKIGYVIPRLVIGVSVLLLCSYRTLPLYAFMKSQMNQEQGHSEEESEMKVVTWIWNWIERNSKVATNNESTQAGAREGPAANERTKAGEIEPEMEADIEAQGRTKPAYT